MSLSTARRKELRTIAHKLNPIITIAGNGLTDNHIEELNRALEDHELIKVKLVIEDRELRKQVAKQTAEAGSAEIVQEIGKVIVLYRKAKEAKPKLSNILRNPL